jgi:hypothetical protein
MRKRGLAAICLVIVAVVVICAVSLYFASISPSTTNLFTSLQYSEVTVVSGQFATFTYDQAVYVFGYGSFLGTTTNNFTVCSGFAPQKFFPLKEGSIYTAFGLEIKVSEVHSEYFVLLVRSVT